LGAGLVAIPVGVAFADGNAHCSRPAKPEDFSAVDAVSYDGTGTCNYPDTTGLASFRVRINLRQEETHWGPLPNEWHNVSGSFSTWSTWAAYNGSRYKSYFMYCSDLNDYTNNFSSRFQYEFVWNDSHETGHTWDSGSIHQC